MKKINFDDGFAFGKGFFETIKVINKKPIMLNSHLNRLNNSLKTFDINKTITTKEIELFTNTQDKSDYVLKIIVSDDNTIFNIKEDNYLNIDRSKGIKLKLGTLIRNSTSHTIYHKSCCYYDNIIENKKAKLEGFDEVIFLNEKKEIAEGSVSNIFFVKGNQIITPKISCGILNGTMRDFIIKNFEVNQDIIKLKDLQNFDGVFITNALRGVQFANEFNNINFKCTNVIKNIISKITEIGF